MSESIESHCYSVVVKYSSQFISGEASGNNGKLPLPPQQKITKNWKQPTSQTFVSLKIRGKFNFIAIFLLNFIKLFNGFKNFLKNFKKFLLTLEIYSIFYKYFFKIRSPFLILIQNL